MRGQAGMIDGWDTGKWIADKSSGRERLSDVNVCVWTCACVCVSGGTAAQCSDGPRQRHADTNQPLSVAPQIHTSRSETFTRCYTHPDPLDVRVSRTDKGDKVTNQSLMKCPCTPHTHTHTRQPCQWWQSIHTYFKLLPVLQWRKASINTKLWSSWFGTHRLTGTRTRQLRLPLIQTTGACI